MTRAAYESLRLKRIAQGWTEGVDGQWFPPSGGKARYIDVAPQKEEPKRKGGIRVAKRRGPNGTEERYRVWYTGKTLFGPNLFVWRYEEITFRLPSGTLYTPDWTLWTGEQLWRCVEVKGQYRLGSHAQAARAFKEACSAFPALTWVWAEINKDGEWHETVVKPKT